MDPIDPLDSIEMAPDEPSKPNNRVVKAQVKSGNAVTKTNNNTTTTTTTTYTTTKIVNESEHRKVNVTADNAVSKAEKDIVVNDGKSLSDLKIEKERLETTVMLLQQKLNDKEDSDKISMKFLDRKTDAEKQRDQYQNENTQLKSQVQKLTNHKEQYQNELKEAKE